MMMKKTLPPEVLEKIAERFRVLAEPARLQILQALLRSDCTVSDLVEQTGLNQANVSKHLGVLRSNRFVARRKESLYSIYRVADPSVGLLCEVMCDRLEAEAQELTSLLAAAT
jgi:ArsR family transcriptional regulator